MLRAGIVLLCADGLDDKTVGEILSADRIQVGRWRKRYAKAWRVAHPRFHMRSTPTSGSKLLNMVEHSFLDITTARLRNGVFRSVSELTQAIDEYIVHHNERPKPVI